jgi:hypothetical protein
MPRVTRVIHRRRPRIKGAPASTYVWLIDSTRGLTQYCGRKRIRLYEGLYRSDWVERIRAGYFSADRTVVASWARVEHRDACGLITGVESAWIPSRVDAAQYRKKRQLEQEKSRTVALQREMDRAGPLEQMVIALREERRLRQKPKASER